MMKHKWIFLGLILLLMMSSKPIFAQISDLPNIDGKIGSNEWQKGQKINIRMNSGVDVSLTHLYSDTDMYFLVKIPHSAPGDVINLNPEENHDFFGIEFDNNNDAAIMGTSNSPDDMVLVDYIVKGSVDLYSKDFHVFQDVDNGGKENSVGKSSVLNGTIIYEIKKSLNVDDPKGYDIKLKQGETYQIMLAFWDDKPSHSPTAYVNVEVGGNQFIELKVGDFVHPIIKEIIAGTFIGLSAIIFILLEYLRRSRNP